MPQQQSSQNYAPTTFLERGACVPFTTPALAGARVRPGSRCDLEMVVPNPAGGRGDYILPWGSLRSICSPTVHDLQLTESVAALRTLTPSTIRGAARQVASRGLAGRAAVSAANAAAAAEAESRVFAKFELLLRLVQQAEPPSAGLPPPDRDNPSALETRAKRVIAHIAPALRQDKEAINAALGDLAVLLEPTGIGPRGPRARLPQTVAMLKTMRRELTELPMDMDDQSPGLIRTLASAADLTLTCAEDVLQKSRAAVDHLVELLSAWRNDPGSVARQFARADWLMDGWERSCRLWGLSERLPDRRNALDEIVAMLPLIPREAGEWVGFKLDLETTRRTTRLVTVREDWRTGHYVQDVIARNEALIAAA